MPRSIYKPNPDRDDQPSLLTILTQHILDAFRPVMKELTETLQRLGEAVRDLPEHQKKTQERKKNRAYEHMITPPHDHTHAHVTHTSPKPTSPARIYRRRTP